SRNRLWTAGSRDGGATFPCVAIVTPPGDESWSSLGHALAVAGGNVYWAWLTDEYDLVARRSNDAGRSLLPAEKVLDNPSTDFAGAPELRASGNRGVLLYGKESRPYNEQQHKIDFGYEPEALVTADGGASWSTRHLGDEGSRCVGDVGCGAPYSLIFEGQDVY